ncbi:MAG: hypothetical protein ACFE0O_08980 [Opitutales bacterium]
MLPGSSPKRLAWSAFPTPGKAWLIIAAVFGLPCLLWAVAEPVQTGNTFASTLPIAEYLGPLAPVALSPFFGITCLSGAALLAETGLVDALAGNPLLTSNETLSHPLTFLAFLGLTGATSAPKFMKLTKPMAQAVDQLEAYAGIVSIAVIQGVSSLASPQAGEEVAVVYQAGFFQATGETLLIALSAINIFVINAVKFFFEVLIFLSPIPFVDALFETLLKLTTAGLMAIYVFSPSLALTINLILFFSCLLVFRWVYRIARYYRVLLFSPLLHRMLGAVGLSRKPGLRTAALPPGKLKQAFPEPQLVLPGFTTGSGWEQFAKRQRVWLVVDANGAVHLARPTGFGFGQPVIQPLADHRLGARTGLVSEAVTVAGPDGGEIGRFVFSTRYRSILPEIHQLLGLEGAPVGQASPAETYRAMGKRLGQAVQGDAMRGELA